MNLQRLSINTGRKSIISFFDILHKRSQSTAVTTYKSHDNRQSMHITGFQLLSHKSYYPFMIESITHQLDLLDKFVLVIEQITDARQLYSTTLKNICQSLTENVENTESIKNDNNINDNNEVLFDLWRTFVEKAHNEAELQSNYAEMYRIYREVIQTKTIKDLLNAHNSYVLQLHMTNTMKAYYHNLILPQLMQEFETIVRENTTEFIQIFDYFCSIHANMFDQLICNNNGVQIKMKEITPDAIVSIIVQNLNKNKNPTHWHLMEYLPPDGDCPEILCSDHVIIDNLVKIELQCKFNELKRQFAELSSFMQQNVNIVDTLKSLEKR
ncbi:tyrosine- kinase Fes Fps-like [Schistosoma japonicum]|nr:tyrosine- kinase Fes Fps-like [Schistosoma japonicum]